MYQTKNQKHAWIAIAYYIAMVFGYILMGVLYKNGIKQYSLILWGFFVAAVLIVVCKDKSIENLGFSKGKVKRNASLAIGIVAVSVVVAVCFGTADASAIVRGVLYYLFYIALQEELIFRGFLQNYLFGLRTNKIVIYLTGAILFSLIHLPFQMYVNNMVSLSYVLVAWPQLIFTFCFHLLMCFITYKSKDILIPTALHFALDFIQAVL